MGALSSIAKTPVPARKPGATTWRAVGVVLVLAAVFFVPAAPASAEPEVDLEELSQRADKLSKQYKGALHILNQAEESAQQSEERAQQLEEKLARTRKQVSQLAATKYMNGGLPPSLTATVSGNPQTVLDRAATLDYLAERKSRQLRKTKRLSEQTSRAQQKAEKQIEKVAEKVEALEENKNEVKQLIAKYSNRVSGSTSVSGCPGNITSRMCNVRNLVIQNFGKGPAVGCYRPGSFGEHPEGRACDFMLSTGGGMPSSGQVQHGKQIAQWAIDNADRLGIMYIIYRQRIWDSRTGGGWDPMQDRGSVTANHYDHVHISVF